ncbi:PRC-barrel domain-containing protein [Thermosynechococcaceae cyanobacterium BACA0444]|uniref:PRC-barrel domain-containing protein n=1 Tax=Pseudocalidococcus azoricus BACA0444 TaxID=2918990 RepID=A0AAE4JWZ4_9CYAN|nr:PRC-barrel domain-containing protein [Pseudocalidococcus azoricus]MDS3861581.1 PRC-barrel domain-containing protein [Pseudocalidococcus azoricus BACA0444]
MYKGRDFIGKPLVCYESGEKFDKIEDLIFDQNSNQLLGFLVNESKWFSSTQILLLKDVQVIGPDAVITPSKSTVVAAKEIPAIHYVMERNNILNGTRILTVDGHDLGIIVDLYFDEKTGQVEGYEVSGGLFADTYSGRSFVPALQTLKIGRDVAFVPTQTAQLMEEQVGGIRGAMQTVTDKVQETAQGTGDKVQELTEQVVHAVAGFTVEQAQGRRSQQFVRAKEGSIITAPGQIVTELIIKQAKVTGKEKELLEAVGLTTQGAMQNQAGQFMTEAGARLKSTGENTGETLQSGAKGLWSQIKDSAKEIQEMGTEAIEKKRIQGALGRAVNRVILDQQDDVILNVGELITHQAIASARQAQVLELLLSSVYTDKPNLTLEDMRAPHAGRDAL